jgi:hypothetical protein
MAPLRIPLGLSDLRRLREDHLFYVDKSLLIRDLIDDAWQGKEGRLTSAPPSRGR